MLPPISALPLLCFVACTTAVLYKTVPPAIQHFPHPFGQTSFSRFSPGNELRRPPSPDSMMMPTHYTAPHGNYLPMYVGGPVYPQQHQQQQTHPTDVRPLSRYGGDTSRSSPSHDARLPADNVQLSNDVSLSIRQQPREALVTVDGKEKARKPVDPPPIIQLKVKQHADPQGHFMQSPYLIMIADLWHPEEDKANPEKALSGTICSSLHRLKDVDNKDGAFFVFGDISIKQQGEHRLRFSLFDIHKPGNMYEFVDSIVSDKFKVVSQKDFHGMDESTYLSRAFSDQGVRLRLRKEPRHVMGSRKRSPPNQQSYEPPAYQPPTPTNQPALVYQQTPGTYHQNYDQATSTKRQRVDEDSSPRYSASHVHSSPSTQLPTRQAHFSVQSPSNMAPLTGNWNNLGSFSGGSYGYGRGMMNNTSAAGELPNMAPPPLNAPMPYRPTYSSAHTSGMGLPSVTSRADNLFGGIDSFQSDQFLGSSYHDRQTDSQSGASNSIDYSTHTTDGMRGMPVQSPEQSFQPPRSDFNFPSSLQPSVLPSYESSGSRSGSVHGWAAPLPPSRYEERCDRARSQYHINPIHSSLGGNDGHHSSSNHSTGFDEQFKHHDDHHFKTEGQ